ncbi:hypothetical protein ACODT5_07580 [Streptomyces sp. 5.8]|uniref:hypothetical protein n=1 Tax=Streptomyces sp. 5.8 TaxID=3406571 RepID=UPI003BB799A9
MAHMVTESERAAQRRMVAVVRISGVLSGGGLAVWRDDVTGEWKASPEELSQDLDLLGVPHETVIAFRPPRAREARRRKGRELRIPFAELGRLVRWVPSLQQSIDELPAGTPGFTFTCFEPRRSGMATVLLSCFAADWPTWSVRQAGSMGLLCARCGFDLRTRGPGHRPAYNIPEEPERRRLVCGTCCGNGLPELEWPSGAGAPT